jgi:hypothetical protein
MCTDSVIILTIFRRERRCLEIFSKQLSVAESLPAGKVITLRGMKTRLGVFGQLGATRKQPQQEQKQEIS